jgi:opacity protein-like surface antigen
MSRTFPCRLLAAASLLLPAAVLAQGALSPGGLVVAADTSLKLDVAGALSAAGAGGVAAPFPQAADGGSGGSLSVSITPSVWVPAIKGDVAAGGNMTKVDNSLSDAFEDVGDARGGLEGHLEISLGKLTLFGDALYLDLEPKGSGGVSSSNATASIRGWVLEAGAAYAVLDTRPQGDTDPGFRIVVEPLGGVRVHIMDMSIDDPFLPIGGSDNKRWVDGFGGVRGRVQFAQPFTLFGRADIGAGESTFTWSAAAGAEFNFSRSISLGVGYKWLKVDFKEGSAASLNAFTYDLLMQGPYVELTIRF